MMARGALVLAVLALAGLAGCMGANGGTVNPALLAPKLLLDVRTDGVPLVYVHSAFGERAYERIEVSVNNDTTRIKDYAYSLEQPLNRTDFYLEVKARSGESRFAFRGMMHLDVERERVRVSVLGPDDEWSEARQYALPYERILDKQGGAG